MMVVIFCGSGGQAACNTRTTSLLQSEEGRDGATDSGSDHACELEPLFGVFTHFFGILPQHLFKHTLHILRGFQI